MDTGLLPNAAEARDNAIFEGLLWALSRPGQIRDMGAPGALAIVNALVDRECLVYAADPLLVPDIMRTGAAIAEIDRADHVFLGTMTEVDAIAQIAVGSDLYPDDGATVIVNAQLSEGPALRLTGPGIEDSLNVQIGGLPVGFWAAREARQRYPMGFDLFFVEGARVLGLPRSTTVEVL